MATGTSLLVPVDTTLYRSPQASVSWTAAAVQPPFPLLAVEVDPTASQRILGLGNGRLARTEDGGATWQPVTMTGPAARTTSVAVAAAGSALVNAESGLVRTDDHGSTFVASSQGLGASPPGDYPGPAVSGSDPTRAAVFTSPSALFVSSDGGRSWSSRTYGIPNSDGVLAFAPSDASRVYAAGFTGAVGVVRRSVNAGDSWGPVGANPSFGFAEGLAVDVTAPLVVYLSTTEGLFVSLDGGDSWTPGGGGLPPGGTGRVIADPVTSGRAYLVAASKVWRTTDRGATWTSLAVLPSGSPRDVVADPAAPSMLFAGTETGVFRSTDGGGTWEAYSTGLPSLRVNDLAIDRDGTVLYAATDRGLAVTSLVAPAAPSVPIAEPVQPPAGPTVAPSRPLKPAAKAKKGKVILTWRTPATGAPLSGYVVQAKPKNKKKSAFKTLSATVKPAATRYVWTKAKKGRVYLLRAAAKNAVGRGPFSKAVSVRVRAR